MKSQTTPIVRCKIFISPSVQYYVRLLFSVVRPESIIEGSSSLEDGFPFMGSLVGLVVGW